MIRAIPNNGNPSIVVDGDLQSDIEDVMTALGYGCTEYTLEMAESAADGDIDARDLIDNLINGLNELRDRISPATSPKDALYVGLDGHTKKG